MRRYVNTGTQRVGDPESGEMVEPGGVVRAEPDATWTRMQVDAGVLTLESDADEPKPQLTRCPICAEHLKTRVPAFATSGELEAHYTDKHPGFAVPEWKGGSS